MASLSTSHRASRETEDQQTPPALQPAPPGTLGDRRLPVGSSRSATAQQTIDNPLLTFDDTVTRQDTRRTELEEYVLDFTKHSHLEDRFELLLFGARLARDKHEAMIRYDGELTAPERVLLTNEAEKNTGFWKQSKFFRATIITASLGGCIQGWTQSINNGSNYGMPEEFGLCIISRPNQPCNGNTRDLWTLGMLNAIPLFSAGIFGTTLADPLQENYLGRRGSILVSALITIASTIGASATQSVGQLAACRALNGIALGAKGSIVPIYSAEISPEHIRGKILANWQLADALGMFLGFTVNLIIVSYVFDTTRSWRILTNTVLIPTIPLLILIYLMPESPRYLMKHGKYRKALESFCMIQTTPLLASRDFMYAHAQLDFESRLMRGKADEHGNLAERIARSEIHLPNEEDNNADRVFQICASPPQLNHRGNEDRLQTGNILEPRDSHQSLRLQPPGRQGDIELSSIGQHSSDTSSTDGEIGFRRVGGKDNPYFYHIGVTGYFMRLRQLWTNLRCRRALLAASIAMIGQQMTGVNSIAFLGTTVWQNSLKTTTDPKTIAGIGLFFGAANYLGGLPAYWLSDKYGRSILQAAGHPNMAWSMLVFAFLFKLPESSHARVPLVSIFAVVFTLFYAPTAGTSPFSISAEVFPLVSREVGMAVSVAVNLLGAGILVLLFPMLMQKIGITGSLSIFAGLNLVAFVLVYLFVPETRRRTLEELQYTFDLSTRWHVEYRAGYVRRHFVKNFRKYVTRQEVRPPIPFYRWARITYGERMQNS
ncbi:MFS general substrate transporter [Lindgomyces ingoldianus]|uniref:MFS general substrate transporter n=1 Tax=Lindgomyces ingoldianus TaxID=673940 RepID=A0ACB6QDK4_9PLEO|nr:MFS general substrate transporter [Lindgomyces ingoldianus]KAF2464226.1 MFS general substrate transporter [Lindgomyces ingoldianus]